MRIVIAGAGEVGSHLAKMLSNESNDITVIDIDPGRLHTLSESADIITVEGSSSSIEVLREAGADKADLFIAVNPDTAQDVNIVSAVLAKRLGSKKVTARINNEEYLAYENREIFPELGIDLLFYPEKIAAGEIVDLLKRTGSNDSATFGKGKLQLAAFRLDEESPLLDKKLIEFTTDISARGHDFRVAAIARKNETLMAHPDTKFKYHDLVFIVAKADGMATIMDYLGREDKSVRKLMILGGGTIGEMVAKAMAPQSDLVKIVEISREKCIGLSERLRGIAQVANGDGRNTDTLLDESIKEYDAFVAVTGNSEANILACVAAKKMGVDRTIAEVENLEYIRLAEEMGVDAVINKKLITAGRIFKFTLSSKVRFVKYMSGTDAEVLEYTVEPGAKITKAPLKDLDFPREAVIGGLIRGDQTMIAVGSTRIEPYDSVVVFAAPDVVKDVDRFFR